MLIDFVHGAFLTPCRNFDDLKLYSNPNFSSHHLVLLTGIYKNVRMQRPLCY